MSSIVIGHSPSRRSRSRSRSSRSSTKRSRSRKSNSTGSRSTSKRKNTPSGKGKGKSTRKRRSTSKSKSPQMLKPLLEPTETVDHSIKRKCWNSTTKSLISFDDGNGYFYKIGVKDLLKKTVKEFKDESKEHYIGCYLKKFKKGPIIFKDIFNDKLSNTKLNSIKDGNYTYVLINVGGIDYFIVSPIISELEISSKHLCLPLLLEEKLPRQNVHKDGDEGRYYNLNVYSAGNLKKQKDEITIDFYSGSFFTIVMDVYQWEKKKDLRTQKKQQEHFDKIKLSFFKKNVNIKFSFEELKVLDNITRQELVNLIECGFTVHRSPGIRKKDKLIYDKENEEVVTLENL
jgi:hypothetical protein